MAGAHNVVLATRATLDDAGYLALMQKSFGLADPA